MIGFTACHQNIAGNQKINTFADNDTHVAFQIQGFWRKKLKFFLKGSLVLLKSFRGQRKTGSNINGI